MSEFVIRYYGRCAPEEAGDIEHWRFYAEMNKEGFEYLRDWLYRNTKGIWALENVWHDEEEDDYEAGITFEDDTDAVLFKLAFNEYIKNASVDL